MRRIIIWLASTVTVVVLLFGYHTSSSSTTALAASEATSPPSASSGASSSPATTTPSTTTKSSATPATKTPTTTAPSATAKTYTGSVAQTRWGPVQVKITVAGGQVTQVDVVEYPTGNPKDAEINGYALPILVKDTLAAQSATIDMVSGATVTSTGYLQSLQAALDDAGL